MNKRRNEKEERTTDTEKIQRIIRFRELLELRLGGIQTFLLDF